MALEGRGLVYGAGGTGVAFPVVWEAERVHLGGGGADSSKCDIVLCEGDSDETQEVWYSWGGSKGPRDAQGDESEARLGSMAVCPAAWAPE